MQTITNADENVADDNVQSFKGYTCPDPTQEQLVMLIWNTIYVQTTYNVHL